MNPLTTNDAKYGSVRPIDFAPAAQVSVAKHVWSLFVMELEKFERLKAPDTPATVGDIAMLDDPDAD